MDATKLNGDIRNQLDNIKNLFSKFVVVANQINNLSATNECQFNIENSPLVSKSGSTNVEFGGVDSVYENGNLQENNAAKFHIESNVSVTKFGSTNECQFNIENSPVVSKSGSTNVAFGGVESVYENGNLQENNAAKFHIESNVSVTKFGSTNECQFNIENSPVVSKSGSTNVAFGGVESVYENGNLQENNAAKFHIESNVSVTKFGSTNVGQFNIENSPVVSKSGSTNVEFGGVDSVYENRNVQGKNAAKFHIESNVSVLKSGSTNECQFNIESSPLVSDTGSKNVVFSGFDDNENSQRKNAARFHTDDIVSIEATKFASTSSICSNVEIMHKEVVMGYELPYHSTFDEYDHLVSMLNKPNYTIGVTLTPDSDGLHAMELETLKEVTMNETYDPVDGVGSEIALLDYPAFDSANDLMELDNGHSSTITKSTLVTATPVTDLFDASVVSENTIEVNKPSPSVEVKDTTPWKINIQRHRGCDNVEMFVPSSDSWDKRHCCPYCRKRYRKFVRHLETVHKSETAVTDFHNLPIGSKARRNIIDEIRKKGDFEWNSDFQLNGGELIPCRLPAAKFERKATDFDSCAKCLGSFAKSGLSHHFKNCTNDCLKGERSVKVLSRRVEGRANPKACDMLVQKVIPKVQDAKVAQLIRFDWLIIEFGNDLCLNYFRLHQVRIIRDRLRDAGKLLLAAKSISPEITDLASLYQVKHCNVAIEAVRLVSKFDQTTNTFASPTSATILVTLIKAIGELLVIERMKQDDQEQENVAQRFLTVFTKDARLKINKSAYLAMKLAKIDRVEDLPSTSDVGRFADYLDCERNKYFDELSQQFTYDKWKKLSELTLASILVFNRRRVGESSRIPKKAFEQREIIAEQRDKLVDDAIPESTSQLIKSKMKFGAKRDRGVPVLLPHSVDNCLELLLSHRKDAGIPDENTFLFAMPNSALGDIKHLDAGTVIRDLSSFCSAENPGSLRGTKLRKHMATMCGTMNLNDMEVTNVAHFMGHDDPIHRNVYRHNTLQREVTQMAPILQKIQGRNINVTTASDCDVEVVSHKRKKNSTASNATGKKQKEQLPERKRTIATKNKTRSRK